MDAYPTQKELKQSLANLRRQKRTLVTLFFQFNKAKSKLCTEDATSHYELYGQQIHRVTKRIANVESALKDFLP
jgi:hypothetical protein